MERQIRTVDDLDPRAREYPFVRQGMSIEEYTKEKLYYGKHIKEVKEGTYKPLWQQI